MTLGYAAQRSKELDAAARAVASAELGRACRLYDSVAAAILAEGSPSDEDRHDALVVRQPWFGFGYEELARALEQRGCRACFMDPDVKLGAEHPGVTAANWRELAHGGVRLWEVSRYDFCIRHELSLAEVEPTPDAHLAALAAEYGRATRLIDRVARYLDAYQPSQVLVAQGHVMASAVARALGLARGLRVVAIENTLHARRLLWDDGAALPVVQSPARSGWWRWRDRVSDSAAHAFAETYLAQLKSLKTAQHATPERTAPPLTSGRRTIVFLAQVATDSSVLFGIGTGFERQLDVLRTVAEHAVRRGHQLVVKLHPKERDGRTPLGEPYDRLTLRQAQADPALAALLDSRGVFVDGDNEFDTYALIDRADLCVTINSQAGLEALIKGKELVVCGDAFYGALGFTHQADDAATLEACIDRVLATGTLRNAVDTARAFFQVYLSRTCCEKTPAAIAELLARGSTGPTSSEAEPEAADDAYDSGERQTALRYDEIRVDHRARYEFAADALASVSGGAPLAGVDAFCGNGYGTWLIAERSGASLVGIDGCAQAIEVAEARYSNDTTSFQELQFPFELPKERFDFATCFESIEHVEDGALLLARLANALRPGGLLFLSTPNEAALPFRENRDFFRFHFRHYHREELLDLAGSVGLAPRLELGQSVYRMQGPRALGAAAPEAMGLREDAECPQFLLHVFERLADVPSSTSSGARLALRDPGEIEVDPAPESASEICVTGTFEQLGFAEGRRALAAWQRALAPGGKLELLVPDLHFHVERYIEAARGAGAREQALAGLFGTQSTLGGHAGVHKAGYDFGMLRALLCEHGFVDVVRLASEPHDLRVVCWKPGAAA